MTHDQGVRHGEDLLDAVSWFRDQRISQSSVEIFVERVEQIGTDLAGSNVVEFAEPRRSIR